MFHPKLSKRASVQPILRAWAGRQDGLKFDPKGSYGGLREHWDIEIPTPLEDKYSRRRARILLITPDMLESTTEASSTMEMLRDFANVHRGYDVAAIFFAERGYREELFDSLIEAINKRPGLASSLVIRKMASELDLMSILHEISQTMKSGEWDSGAIQPAYELSNGGHPTNIDAYGSSNRRSFSYADRVRSQRGNREQAGNGWGRDQNLDPLLPFVGLADTRSSRTQAHEDEGHPSHSERVPNGDKPVILQARSGISGGRLNPGRGRANESGRPSAAMDLLPYCTAGNRLSSTSVVALSDAAGSLRDLVLLALAGRLDESGRDALDVALGPEVAKDVRDFWADEYAVE